MTFHDIRTSKAKDLRGYAKLIGCCKIALNDGFDYVWIDTCCIDKTNSVELQEAINSMWDWYRASDVCYVYLSDVNDIEGVHGPESPFGKSRWFTRGWTLQELIAPSSLIFYTAD